MKMIQQHFVHFFSPGTFVSEETRKPIESWTPELAVEMARGIRERHNATPYGFVFSTRERGDDDLDSHEVKRSGMFFLGGTMLTLKQVEERNDPKDKILISNMRGNEYNRVVENTNSWKATLPYRDGDTVLPYQIEELRNPNPNPLD